MEGVDREVKPEPSSGVVGEGVVVTRRRRGVPRLPLGVREVSGVT